VAYTHDQEVSEQLAAELAALCEQLRTALDSQRTLRTIFAVPARQ
jgi:hypothetical protein